MSKIRMGVPKHNPRQGPEVRRTSYRQGDTRAPKLKPSPEFTLFEASNGSRRNEKLRAFVHSCKNFLKDLKFFPSFKSKISTDSFKRRMGLEDRVSTYDFNKLEISLQSLLQGASRISKEELCTSPKKVAITKDVIGSLTTLEEKLQALNQEGFKNDKYHAYVFSGDPNSSRSGPEKFTEALTRLENLLSQVQQSFLKFKNLDQEALQPTASADSQAKKPLPSFKTKASKVRTKAKDEDPWRALRVYSGNLFKGITQFFKKPNIVFNSLKKLRALAIKEPVVQDNVKQTLEGVKSSFERMLAQPPGEDDKVDLLQNALDKTKETLETLAA